MHPESLGIYKSKKINRNKKHITGPPIFFVRSTKWNLRGNLGKLNVPIGCDFYTVHRSVGQFHLNEQLIIIEDTAIAYIFD